MASRKNHIKGSRHDVHYSIAEDYYTVTYQIPDELASEITWYINTTAGYERTSKEERPFGMGGSCTPQDIRRNRPERGLRRRIAGAGAGCSYAKCHGYAV